VRSGSRDGVETVRAGDRSVWDAVDRRRGVSAAAATAPARCGPIRGEPSSTEVVDSSGGDSVVGRVYGCPGDAVA